MDHISAISLFVEDLPAAKAFYVEVFEAPVVYEDANCTVFKFDSVLINLLKVANAPEIIAPGVGRRPTPARASRSASGCRTWMRWRRSSGSAA